MATTAYTSAYTGAQIDAAIGAVADKADKIAEVNHGTSDTTFTLTPNVMHIWGTVTSLTLSLPTDSNSVLDEYMFTFTSGGTPTTLSLPSTVKWVQDIQVEANKTYQVSIVNNLAGWLTNGMPSGGGGGGGGENNVIESISVNSVAQTVDANKNVNLQFKTINNESISGTGNISISGGGNNYIAMTATWDANDEYLENFAFDDASAAYAIYNANGANTVLGIETGTMDGNTFVSDDFYYYAQVDQENAGAQQYFFFEFWDNTDKYKVTIQVNESTLSVNTYSHQDFLGGGEANVIESISVNSVAQTVTNKNVNITVPTKVSDLTNDSGFTSNTGTITGITMNGASKGTSGVVDLGTVLTSYTETDPTVPSWAKASSKPSYTASEVGAVPTSRTVNGKALNTDISLTASDVGAVASDGVVTIYSGSSAPSSSTGNNGDIYIQTS